MRLTKEMKLEIVNALLAHKFKPLVETLAKEVAAFAAASHVAHFGTDLAKMKALPDGWLPTYDRMSYRSYKERGYTIYYNGHVGVHSRGHETWIFDKYFGYNKDGGKRLRHLTSCTSVDVIGGENILDKVIELQKNYEETATELHAALRPFNLAEKLIEHWPEVEPFIPEYVAPIKNLPAVQADELNKKLGLPV